MMKVCVGLILAAALGGSCRGVPSDSPSPVDVSGAYIFPAWTGWMRLELDASGVFAITQGTDVVGEERVGNGEWFLGDGADEVNLRYAQDEGAMASLPTSFTRSMWKGWDILVPGDVVMVEGGRFPAGALVRENEIADIIRIMKTTE